MSLTESFLQQLARRTGESRRTIIQRGFHEEDPVPSPPVEDDDRERTALYVDCPECRRSVFLGHGPDDLPDVADCPRCDTLFIYGDAEIEVVDLSDDHAVFDGDEV